MEMKQVLAAEEIMYRPFITMITQRLKEIGIVPETPMQCHPKYPDGFEAVFLAGNQVYTVTLEGDTGSKNNMDVFRENFKGYYPTGALIRTNRRKIVWT